MNKNIFYRTQMYRNNAIKLAHRIYNDGFIPDIIYVPLRGGAYLGNIISEYFKIIQKDNRPGILCSCCSKILFRCTGKTAM